jgi:hypothetical protein
MASGGPDAGRLEPHRAHAPNHPPLAVGLPLPEGNPMSTYAPPPPVRNADGTYDNVDLDGLLDRLERAVEQLSKLSTRVPSSYPDRAAEHDRLRHKADGVLIAFGYVDELRRVAQ